MLWASSCAMIRAPLPMLRASDIVQDAWVSDCRIGFENVWTLKFSPVSCTCQTGKPCHCCLRHWPNWLDQRILRQRFRICLYLAYKSSPVKRSAWSQCRSFLYKTNNRCIRVGLFNFIGVLAKCKHIGNICSVLKFVFLWNWPSFSFSAKDRMCPGNFWSADPPPGLADRYQPRGALRKYKEFTFLRDKM